MARQAQASLPDKRSDVNDTSVAIQCLVAHNQSFNEVGSFNTGLFFCSSGRLSSEGIRRDKIFITFMIVYGTLTNSSSGWNHHSLDDDWFYEN